MQKSNLQKQAKAVPQYILKLEGLNLYVSANQGISGVQLVAQPKKAMKYAVGFDNEETKTGIWSVIAQRQYNNKDMKFEVVYL